MKIKELFSQTDAEEVLTHIKFHYKEAFLEDFRCLYKTLSEMSPKENANDMIIIINAFIVGDEDDIWVKDFNECDNSLYYDVSAISKNEDIVYSIVSLDYASFLGYYVDDSILSKLSAPSILAHCMWELTAYSFKDKI